jgi:hypothetical protein
LLPADRETPVLSGRLDADVNLAADDLADPVLERSLRGGGRIELREGAIGESSLFRAVGGGSGLGQVGGLLLQAVPSVGNVLSELSRSLAFRRVTSRFTVADRTVRIEEGLLESERARIAFSGTVDFDERLDLRVPVTIGGAAGDDLARVLPSRTIPLGVRGTLERPVPTPGLRVEDLAGSALENLLPREGRDAIDRLRGLLGR